jgi:hypothetical protein
MGRHDLSVTFYLCARPSTSVHTPNRLAPPSPHEPNIHPDLVSPRSVAYKELSSSPIIDSTEYYHREATMPLAAKSQFEIGILALGNAIELLKLMENYS